MMSDEENDVDETVSKLVDALNNAGATYCDPVDGDIYVEWYLSDLMEFCREWRSEIEELG